MAIVKALRCPKCGDESESKTAFQCLDCGVVREAIINTAHLTRSRLHEIRKSTDLTIWRWHDFLPIHDRSNIVSLGEGYTPLIRSKRLCQELGLNRLYLKNDTMLPTGSLKDRSNSVGLSKAKELGFETAVALSTGNAAASVAAYAAVAGLRCVVMVPTGTSFAKIVQARAYGARVVCIDGDLDNEGAKLYNSAIEQFGWYDTLSSNPYRNEGKKSYAYEMFDQLDEHVPDWVIHPTAGGAGISAMWKGFNELTELGWAHRKPRLVAAQSQAAAPIVAAFERGNDNIDPVSVSQTVAESIKVGNPSSLGWRALSALRDSKGTALALTDEVIIEAQMLLGHLAGVFAEPAGAISLAAAQRLQQQGILSRDDTVVCNITGHGLKQPDSIPFSEDELKPIAPTLPALRQHLEKYKE